MPLFTRSKPLTSNPTRQDEIDAFLSSEAERTLEDSFASNMSLNSPPRVHLNLPSEDDVHEYAPMDISPAPLRVLPSSKSHPPRHEEDSTGHLAPAKKIGTGRPRSSTTSGAQRLFGKDVSNNRLNDSTDAWAPLNIKKQDKGQATEKNSKRSQRTAMPFDWVQNSESDDDDVDNMVPPSSAMKVRHVVKSAT
ncbi:hypothetical protein BC629DRAFT_1037236 [Irpex lacteus]|nr:hypothetical protein BC629DRAFT_1037236 [Irpex lacteus]